MQLNPARGRKLTMRKFDIGAHFHDQVYAAQPREGTETLASSSSMMFSRVHRFMQLNPARGRKLPTKGVLDVPELLSVYAAQPREGTETGSSDDDE